MHEIYCYIKSASFNYKQYLPESTMTLSTISHNFLYISTYGAIKIILLLYYKKQNKLKLVKWI